MRRDLESAFRRTRYRVHAPHGELLLRVDVVEPALASLLRARNVREAALLTAFNPAGKRHPPFRNRQTQRALRAELLQSGLEVLEGRNEDPRGLWPAEPTLLALGLPLPRAQRIALRYGQVALLWLDATGMPRLVEAATAAVD